MIKGEFLRKRTVSFFAVAILLVLSSGQVKAQVQMSMKAELDDETTRFIDDILNRRVILSPIHIALKNAEKDITIDIHNPTKDTLKLTLYLSDTMVGSSRVVSKDSSVGAVKGKTPYKGLLKDDSSDSLSYAPKSMSKWVSAVPKSMTILPGEKKSVSIVVNIPDNAAAGEYRTWIVAEVSPRKMIPEVSRAAFTISTVKLTYKAEPKSN